VTFNTSYPVVLLHFVCIIQVWSSGSMFDHRSLPPVFESQCGHIWRLFCLWLCFITFGGRSAHLAYHVQKSGHQSSTSYRSNSCCFDVLLVKRICLLTNPGSHITEEPSWKNQDWVYDYEVVFKICWNFLLNERKNWQ